MAQLFYHFPRACFYLGARNPFATPAFVDLLAGSIGYSEVLLRLFGTLPLYLLTETAAGIAGVLGGPKQRHHIRTLMYHNM